MRALCILFAKRVRGGFTGALLQARYWGLKWLSTSFWACSVWKWMWLWCVSLQTVALRVTILQRESRASDLRNFEVKTGFLTLKSWNSSRLRRLHRRACRSWRLTKGINGMSSFVCLSIDFRGFNIVSVSSVDYYYYYYYLFLTGVILIIVSQFWKIFCGL